ncbi:MAG: cytochrome c3 family protein [Desulfobacteraceae bacterium]
MKRGMLTLVLVLLAGLVFLTVGGLTAADVPDEVCIENTGYKADRKGPVKLSHKKHNVEYKVACTECHHEYEEGKNVWQEGQPVKKCGACHNPLKKEDKMDKLRFAYHKNCKNCHKQNKDKNAPYRKCNDCHEKKS